MTFSKLLISIIGGFILAYLGTNAVLNAWTAVIYVTSDVPFMWSPIMYLTAIVVAITAFLVSD